MCGALSRPTLPSPDRRGDCQIKLSEPGPVAAAVRTVFCCLTGGYTGGLERDAELARSISPILVIGHDAMRPVDRPHGHLTGGRIMLLENAAMDRQWVYRICSPREGLEALRRIDTFPPMS